MAEYISGEKHHAMSAQKQKQSHYTKPVLIVVAALALVGLSFFGGVQYQKGHQSQVTARSARQSGAGGFGAGGRFNGQQPTFGQVAAVSPSSITVNDQNGSATTFTITSGTAITDNRQAATISDIKVGDTVAVITDSSGSSQASRILVNPSFGGNTPSSSSSSNSQY